MQNDIVSPKDINPNILEMAYNLIKSYKNKKTGDLEVPIQEKTINPKIVEMAFNIIKNFKSSGETEELTQNPEDLSKVLNFSHNIVKQFKQNMKTPLLTTETPITLSQSTTETSTTIPSSPPPSQTEALLPLPQIMGKPNEIGTQSSLDASNKITEQFLIEYDNYENTVKQIKVPIVDTSGVVLSLKQKDQE
jgi:hypothetical protein